VGEGRAAPCGVSRVIPERVAMQPPVVFVDRLDDATGFFIERVGITITGRGSVDAGELEWPAEDLLHSARCVIEPFEGNQMIDGNGARPISKKIHLSPEMKPGRECQLLGRWRKQRSGEVTRSIARSERAAGKLCIGGVHAAFLEVAEGG